MMNRTFFPDPAEEDWDVVVVGAGPAGSFAAREIATRGARVLLLEQKEFPRAKVCGGCLNLRVLDQLRDAGLLQKVERLGAIPLREFRLASAGRQVRIPLPGGLAVSRAAFDRLLADSAVEAGATVRFGVQAAVGPVQADRRRLSVHDSYRRWSIRAKVVVWAAGLGSVRLESEGLTETISTESRLGVGSILTEPAFHYRPGAIYMAVGRAGYVGAACVEEGRLNAAAALSPESVKRLGVGECVRAVVAEAGLPPLPDVCETQWRGTAALTRRLSRPAAHRMLIVGDAAGYVEPFTGEGIAWALEGGSAVVDLALRAVDRWDDQWAERWSQDHARRIVAKQNTCRWLTRSLGLGPIVRAGVWALARFPSLAAPVVWNLNRRRRPIAGAFP